MGYAWYDQVMTTVKEGEAPLALWAEAKRGWGRVAPPVKALVGFVIAAKAALTWLCEHPEHAMVYGVQIVPISAVGIGVTPRLSASLDGEPIDGDLSMLRVALWNAGRTPVRADDVLEPIRVGVERARLLGVEVAFQSRGVIGATATSLETGEVGLGFRILEPDDGLEVRLLCAHRGDLRPGINGTLLGQPQLYQSPLRGSSTRLGYPAVSPRQRNMPVVVQVVLYEVGLLISMLCFAGAANDSANSRGTGRLGKSGRALLGGFLWVCAIGCAMLLVALTVSAIKSAPGWGPPFPF